ncbi:MAG: epoxyqueuosine reductase [Thermodesulfobacteriota bacterium]
MRKGLLNKLLFNSRGYRRLSLLTDIRGMKSSIGEMRGLFFPPQPKLNKGAAMDTSRLNEDFFVNILTEKVRTHPQNAMEGPLAGERIFEDPLVGFVRGDDPIFDRFKEIIGPHHFTPAEIMAWQAARNNVPAPPASAVSVVSFILPLNAKTRADNAGASEWLCERWAQTRLLGEIFSQTMVREVVTFLMENGVLAIAPDVTPLFNKKRYPKVGWASPWSHRHIAYAAGLGTFGMQDFLITEKGVAMRCGSFVVALPLSPNRTRPNDIHAHCLHRQGVKCLKCAARCPVNAINESGHDKETCYERVKASTTYVNRNYHIFIYGCGLCATNVPCECKQPKIAKAKAKAKDEKKKEEEKE